MPHDELCSCPAHLAARARRASQTKHSPSLDPALWVIRRKFGVAGGPDEVALTDEGMARAFSIGAQVRLGPASRALEALSRAGGEGLLEVRNPGNGRLYPTSLGQHDQIAWMRLKGLGYVESTENNSGVILTTLGRARVQGGFEAREDLLRRCRQIAKEEGLIP